MTDVQPAPAEDKSGAAVPPLADYLLSPNAVFNDEGVQWRYGRAPDYSKTRKVWEEGRKMRHAAGSLEQIVENLVKNWEVEASFKPRLEDWRTVDPQKYTFAMSGGPGQSGEHMLKVGTYNAIIAPNEYYDPSNSDFASSHKTFKRMMPTFAWEVMEVYSGPPKVVFKWRHWGVMKNDYVGFNNKGQKVTAKAHGGPIEIYGTTVAVVDEQTRVQSLDTYMDSLDMFRQIAPHGVVNAEPIDHRVELADALDPPAPSNDGAKIAQEYNKPDGEHRDDKALEATTGKHTSNSIGQAADAFVPDQRACPFPGLDGTNGAQPPHPLPSQNGDSMSVDTTSADTEFSDSVLVPREDRSQGTSPPTSSEAPSDAADPTRPTQQGAAMELDNASTPPPADISTESRAGSETTGTKRPADNDAIPPSTYSSSAVTGHAEDIIKVARRTTAGGHPECPTKATDTRDAVRPHSGDVEHAVRPGAGEVVAAAAYAGETVRAKEEMSEIWAREAAGVMNRE